MKVLKSIEMIKSRVYLHPGRWIKCFMVFILSINLLLLLSFFEENNIAFGATILSHGMCESSEVPEDFNGTPPLDRRVFEAGEEVCIWLMIHDINTNYWYEVSSEWYQPDGLKLSPATTQNHADRNVETDTLLMSSCLLESGEDGVKGIPNIRGEWLAKVYDTVSTKEWIYDETFIVGSNGSVTTTTSSVTSSSTTTTAETTTTSSMGEGVVILHHTMTKQYTEPNVDCDNPPPPEYAFSYNDELAYLWVSWEGAVEQDTGKVTLHTPEGDQILELPGTFPYSSGCGGAIHFIRDYPEYHIPGEWRFDFYVNDVKEFSEYFNIVDPNTTTTTTSVDDDDEGGLGEACYEDGTCNEGLICVGTICMNCPIAYALEGDEAQLDAIRDFRDNVLSKTPEGQELIELYYQWSPVIMQAMEEDEQFKEQVKEMVDGVLELIE